MAVDKLALYSNALTLLGQRSLSSLTEDRDVRYLLDGAYDLDAMTRDDMNLELLRVWGEQTDGSKRKTIVFVTHSII